MVLALLLASPFPPLAFRVLGLFWLAGDAHECETLRSGVLGRFWRAAGDVTACMAFMHLGLIDIAFGGEEREGKVNEHECPP